MNIHWSEGHLVITGVPFDPQLTLIDSAQVFHWFRQNETYSAIVSGKPVHLIPGENGFTLCGVQSEDEEFWTHYFDLNRDYHQIADSLSEYPRARTAMQLLPGMRVLNQPPWETLLSFIISANNNVRRIRSLILRLIDLCGADGGFPSPTQLSALPEEALRNAGFGYRAPYLIRTAQMVRDGFPLESLADLSYEDAHRQLLELPGVGDKVADCVQLFSMGHSEAFPVDVWVERLMKKWFLPGNFTKREICLKAREMFGQQAGIVQQSLFHCARLGLIPLDE